MNYQDIRLNDHFSALQMETSTLLCVVAERSLFCAPNGGIYTMIRCISFEVSHTLTRKRRKPTRTKVPQTCKRMQTLYEPARNDGGRERAALQRKRATFCMLFRAVRVISGCSPALRPVPALPLSRYRNVYLRTARES